MKTEVKAFAFHYDGDSIEEMMEQFSAAWASHTRVQPQPAPKPAKTARKPVKKQPANTE